MELLHFLVVVFIILGGFGLLYDISEANNSGQALSIPAWKIILAIIFILFILVTLF